MSANEFVHRKTGEKATAERYIQGVHPPPPGVKVTMGLHGVKAYYAPLDMELYSGDWIFTMEGGRREVFTETFVHNEFRRADEEDGEAKPIKLG